MSENPDPVKKLENWETIIAKVKQILIEGISSEPDESSVDADLNDISNLLIDTSEGKYWHTFRLTDHSKETTIELKMSLGFAKYKKSKRSKK